MTFDIPMTSIPDSDIRTQPGFQYADPASYAYLNPPNGTDAFMESSNESPFSMGDEEFAAVLANYQPCDDCSPSTKTAIPHHHHPPGRLAGASATLAGHFCCSWLIQGQPCFLCFESAQALDNHIKNDHAGKDGTYRCLWQDCCKHDPTTKMPGSINFGNKPKLMRHVHSHTGYKPFPCPYPGCDKGFVTKEQLKNHETTHTKSRKYKCQQCGKAFAVKSALTTHITAVHEEKKTHKCDICGKAFADSSNLSKHKQTHFRDSGVRKQRGRRGMSISTANTSTRSSPSLSTPSIEPMTPLATMQPEYVPTGMMAPPTLPKLSVPNPLLGMPQATHSFISTASTASSPPPDNFDPNCYCCEQRCSPPVGPATPCNDADDCDRDGFCDLPDCFVENDCVSGISCPEMPMSTYQCNDPILAHHEIESLRNYQPWEELMVQDPQRSFGQMEMDGQFANIHGS